MTNRKPRAPSIRLAPVLAQSEHARIIVSIGNDLRAYYAREHKIPIEQVKLEIALATAR